MAHESPSPPPAQPSQTPYWVAICVLLLAGGLLLAGAGFRKGKGDFLAGFPGASGGVPSPATSRRDCPDFSVKHIGDETLWTRADSDGKVTVLHFWATWCPPCRREFPEFARYAAQAQSGDLQILAISLDDDPATAREWARANGGEIPLWTQGHDLAGALDVTGIPATILLDKQGKVASAVSGGQDWSSRGVPRQVEALLRE